MGMNVNTEEKNVILNFLDLTVDYLRDGYRLNLPTEPKTATHTQKEELSEPTRSFSSLPLAYQVDENESEEKTEFTDSLESVACEIKSCEKCGLAATRTLAVPGEGVANPLVMVIGEGPGADEDRSGRPFAGKAGQYLDRMLEAIGLSRKRNCFIANIVKCRPPENREPEQEETSACFPYLERQILLLRPKIILCVGRVAAQNLLRTSQGINALRGEFRELRLGGDTEQETIIPVLCTFHPSAILRDEPAKKRPAWEDLKLLRSRFASLNGE
ncbi:MAG: uracil-DNA glycosylase [Treponema sp.]|jgi:DNA polymerase|nr:uracil-DNA glycosylase [Treponema sp.]